MKDKLSINIERNHEYYMSNDSEPCHCNYCKNYYENIQKAYPEVCSYLNSLGIDVMKPWELHSGEPDKNNIIQYFACQYIVFGTITEDYAHRIGNVEFGISKTHPGTNISEEHFVIEFYPVFLEMTNSK